MKFDVYSDELQEAVFYFIGKHFDDYCRHLESGEDYGMADYASSHKTDFRSFCENQLKLTFED